LVLLSVRQDGAHGFGELLGREARLTCAISAASCGRISIWPQAAAKLSGRQFCGSLSQKFPRQAIRRQAVAKSLATALRVLNSLFKK
jgi:hypothetical protein